MGKTFKDNRSKYSKQWKRKQGKKKNKSGRPYIEASEEKSFDYNNE